MGRIKYGYVVNLEQALTDDIGLFGRWSWNDGKTEIMAFTDIDASLSTGHFDQGHQMGPARRRDRHRRRHQLAVARPSRLHRRRRARHPDRRRRSSTTGANGSSKPTTRIALTKQLTLTADYQLITNPAYNADRGPVHVFSGRLHGEF